jgi:hypothetical protein
VAFFAGEVVSVSVRFKDTATYGENMCWALVLFTHRDDATRACDAAARVQAGAMLTRHWRVHPVKPEKIQSLEVRRTDPIKLSTEQQKMPDKTINSAAMHGDPCRPTSLCTRQRWQR